MSKIDVTERLAFLAKKFDVFECSDSEVVKAKCDAMLKSGWGTSESINTDKGTLMGILSRTVTHGIHDEFGPFIRSKDDLSICFDVFTAMVGADPTDNKICLQWMLNTFSRILKKGEYEEASRFVSEDLPQANEYLTLFEANKRKKKFKEMAEFSLKGFKDITNINEYRNLGQLFDAVDPFIERDPSEVESIMQKYVDMGQAVIPFKDRRYTLFIPKSRDANVIFDKFAGWCTARADNGMFEHYTESYKRPNGENSEIYIVIDNGFFNGENEKIYQIHFESRQIKDRNNSGNVDLYVDVLSKSEGLTNYFGDQLMMMAKDFTKSLEENYYIDILIDFGFTEALFDFFDVETDIIRIDMETSTKKRKVPKLPDVTKFNKLKMLVIMDASLRLLHPSIGTLKTLQMIVISGNEVAELPSEIGNLQKLRFLNIVGNPITKIPENIKYLDTSNGGTLHRLAVEKKDIGEANYRKLVELLPNVLFE